MDTNTRSLIISIITAYSLVICGCKKEPVVVATPTPTPVVVSTPNPTPVPTPKATPTQTPKPTASPAPKVRTHEQMQSDILVAAQNYVGEQEWNGKNRSKNIDKWNKFTGAEMGSPYCASFVSYVMYAANVPNAPRSAWSPDTTATKRVPFSDIQPADVFGMYFASKGRIAHTGFIKNPGYNDTMIQTTEANTSPNAGSGSANDRDGDGVWNKLRPKYLMKNSNNKYSRYW